MAITLEITESEILAEVLASSTGALSPEVAASVMKWKFPAQTARRISRLSQRNQRGTISAAEREVLERYLRVGSLINLLQAKARLSLKATGTNGKSS